MIAPSATPAPLPGRRRAYRDVGEDGAGHQCVAYVSPTTRRVLEWSYLDGDAARRHVPAGPLTVDNGESVVDAALAHAGLAYCHDYLVERELAQGRLVQVLQAINLLEFYSSFPQERQ